ncbi:hypothetical protein [Streptomyces doebereineriae]|uniref:HTH luxR-type domain-containing protein n=1 Tax=Streptomyces doebereineriae TaxID=3075528 RepID=A0ABU2VF55_9ACTN|nr:hypothetical protein [Streptomyces sp. DSM 41640]MDT0484034.1 hypothetical protein [Streptomyces sp. DSM 41640]
MAQGLTSQTIANRLYVSRRTVRPMSPALSARPGSPHVPPWPR